MNHNGQINWADKIFSQHSLNRMLVFGESHLYRVIKEYVEYFNRARPHQGIEQNIPKGAETERKEEPKGRAITFPMLNELHHDYRRAA